MNQVTLEKIRFAMLQRVSRHMLDPKVEISIDPLLDTIDFEIKGSLLGEDIRIYEKYYPADWWQHFKERWFPAWLKRRFPVRYATYQVKVKAVYPDFKPSFPVGDQRYITIAYVSDDGEA